MQPLAPGQQVAISLTASSDGFNGAVETFSEISALLANQGVQVFNPENSQSLLAVIGAAGYEANFQETFVASSQSAYADVSDLLSIISNAVYQATGNLPSSIAATNIFPLGTPEPGASADAPGGSGGLDSIVKAVEDAFKGITSATTTVLIGIVAIIVLVLVLVAYGPNVGKIASAVA